MKQQINSSLDFFLGAPLGLYDSKDKATSSCDSDHSVSTSSVVSSTSSCLKTSNGHTRKRRRSVLFADTVQVQEYAVGLGDHPCADSFPLSLDWAHTPAQSVNIDQYESNFRAQRLTSTERVARISAVTGMSWIEIAQLEYSRVQREEEETVFEDVSFDQDDDVFFKPSKSSTSRRSDCSDHYDFWE